MFGLVEISRGDTLDVGVQRVAEHASVVVVRSVDEVDVIIGPGDEPTVDGCYVSVPAG